MFAELLGRSCFSFLRGASQPEEMVTRAKELDLSALALCDRMGLYGSARAHAQARALEPSEASEQSEPSEASVRGRRDGAPDRDRGGGGTEPPNLRLIVGAELVLEPGLLGKSKSENPERLAALAQAPVVALLVENHAGYSNLCRLLTLAHADHPKGEGALRLEWLAEHSAGLVAVAPLSRDPSGPDAPPEALCGVLAELFAERAVLATYRHLDGFDRARQEAAEALSARFGLEVVASARPLFHNRSRKPLADVVCCIREGVTLDRAGTALSANAEAFLRSELEMQKLFRDRPAWVERTGEIASALRFSLGELRY